ncbi:hypothetical protein [Flavobacterium luteolum]|uniref:hypothetical protein n=1 Tax=Flavobacterium luteolum TaxID=3003259 RepID=UPI00248E4A03|nr:hypothetical protein [Flavobacterium luteolum]
MKKLILLLFILMVFQSVVHAQAKQRKELLLQIAALQVYMDYAKKGYSLVSKGLNFIGDAKKGEVNLHKDYFASLLKINPKVKNYYKTAEIIAMQFKIMKICKVIFAELKGNDLFHGSELDYIERSFDRLLNSCTDTLENLLVLSTDSKLELKDDERIERIDELYDTMMDDYNFCLTFSSQAKMLSDSKAGEKSDTRSSAFLYGL